MQKGILFSILTGILVIPFLTFGQHYPNIESDIKWEGGPTTGNMSLEELEKGFNEGRKAENEQLNTNLPHLDFPDSGTWAELSTGQKVLWILNKERKARGLLPFKGIDSRITKISREYVNYLAENDTSGHTADGLTPRQRLEKDPQIKSCMEDHWEAVFWAGSNNDSFRANFAVFSIYVFLYEDASADWGHRQVLLKNNYNNNNDEASTEGVVGIGLKNTTSYTRYGKTYKNGFILVIHGIDPCSTWTYTSGIKNSGNPNKNLRIYPNPASNNLFVLSPKAIENLSVISASGKEIQYIRDFKNNFLNVSNYKPGVYFLKIQGKECVRVRKFVVE